MSFCVKINLCFKRGCMKKIAVIISDGFEEIEVISVVDILRRLGAKVDVLGVGSSTVTGAHGIPVLADENFDYYSHLDYDGIVFGGGMQNAITLSENNDILKLIDHYSQANKMVAGICASPAVVFSKTKILDGKNFTCYPAEELISKVKNANYVDKSAVVCDNIITSQSPYTAMAFSLTIAKYLGYEIYGIQKELKGN